MFLISFSIIILIHILRATELQLNIDPLSIHVNPDLYRLCWNQINTENVKYLLGSTHSSKINFSVFNDPQQSERTFCIEKKDKHSMYTIEIPFTLNEVKQSIEIIVKFSVPLCPAMNIIRTGIVPAGIHFHLNSEFAGILKNAPSCKVFLLYKTSKSKEIIQFQMDSHSTNKEFKTIRNGTLFTIYYTCHQFTFADTSSYMSVNHGTLFNPEKTFPLKPFIQIPFRKFILALWKHPPIIPDSYVILIRSESSNRNCIRKFRLFKKDFLRSHWNPETININCDYNVSEIDLGYYNGPADGQIKVVLNMDNLLKIDSRYKFSIFWKNHNEEPQENYIYFSPLPNENGAKINSKFLNPNLSDYDNLRNEISSLYQNVISENSDNPITVNNINASGYNHVFILPSISENNYLKIPVIQQETRDNLFNKCESITECASGFYPFFYALFTITTLTDVNTEIIEIPKRENLKINMENLKLLSNNKFSTFNVSWQVKGYPESVAPSLYLVEIENVNTKMCITEFIVKCKTCNNIYKKMSEKNNSKNISHCQSNQVVDNHYNAADSFISFQTNKLPHSTDFVAILYAIQFQSIVGRIVSNSNFLNEIQEESKWKTTNVILVTIAVVACVFILVVLGFCCFKRKAKTPKISKKYRKSDSNYDDDGSNKYDDGDD